jgi:hypothetical protein
LPGIPHPFGEGDSDSIFFEEYGTGTAAKMALFPTTRFLSFAV